MPRVMQRSWAVRVGVVAAVAASAASIVRFASADATATYKPYLYVSPARAGSVRFQVRRNPSDLATYDTEIRVPGEYGARLDQPIGTVIGRVTAAAFQRSPSAPYTGTLTVAKPNVENGCFSIPDDEHAWNVDFSKGARSFAYQVYVDFYPGDITMLRYCLPTDAGVLESIAYSIDGVFKEPLSGTHVWRGQFYPYTAAGEVVDNDAGVSVAALVTLRHVVAFSASYAPSTHRYVLHGSVTEGGVGVGHASVALYMGAKGNGLHPFARLTTGKKGGFTYSWRSSAKSAIRLKAHARVTARVVAAPHCRKINNTRCVSETLSPWANDSRTIAVGP
jgi:hypothetical protein